MSSTSSGPTARRAGPDDAAAIVATLTGAFHDDPTWKWAFPDPIQRPHQYTAFWGELVAGALRYPWVLMTERAEAVAAWIPPGGTELAPEDEPRLVALLEELLGERAGDVLELMNRFDTARPHDIPHYYLSLLGTHPDHAGHGLGMALLAESLSRIDRERAAAYLESSNPANTPRYARYGFRAVGEVFPPGGSVPVTTMWRDAR
jgi:GNAT superfamily N-acetyltransferase